MRRQQKAPPVQEHGPGREQRHATAADALKIAGPSGNRQGISAARARTEDAERYAGELWRGDGLRVVASWDHRQWVVQIPRQERARGDSRWETIGRFATRAGLFRRVLALRRADNALLDWVQAQPLAFEIRPSSVTAVTRRRRARRLTFSGMGGWQ